MQRAHRHFVAGTLTVEGPDLPDGETVVLLARETEREILVSSDEEVELLESLAEADRGETITADELPERLARDR